MFNQSPPIFGSPFEWRRVAACGLAFAAILAFLIFATFYCTSISVVLGMLLSFSGLVVAFAGMHMPSTVVASSTLLFFFFLVSPSIAEPILLLFLVVMSMAVAAFVTFSSSRDVVKAFFVGAVAPMGLADIVLMLINHAPSLLDIEGRLPRYGHHGRWWLDRSYTTMTVRLVIGAALGLVAGIVTMRLTTKPYFPKVLVGLTSCSGAFMIATSLTLSSARYMYGQEVIFFIGWPVAAIVQVLYKPPTQAMDAIFVVEEVVPTTTMASETHATFDKLP
ncbi:Aste57867_14752 [Aphanomyces stellatus]|uniref:Aste57867_14752 protein n=1 Tax=Aphanomyces stellatus TaxID=120398 RepID=A0A485L385_9STRA|nr:hypothetical protein As57867_014697 [Aphanomyces stellatus]VFT91570.1 Aste57867_14752 [Aphanomyces stellatus]